MSEEDRSPFHAGELAAQAWAGRGAAGTGIRDWMPDQHRLFFADLAYVLVAGESADGWPVAAPLVGPPGFLYSPEPRHLHLAAPPDADNPVDATLAPGGWIGLLGIDFGTRRRNRANGRVIGRDAAGIDIAIRQSFGNCAKYIRPRPMRLAATYQRIRPFDRLDVDARRTITEAERCFVASISGQAGGAQGGIDISHRGGEPGFIGVDGDTLTIPDFAGNNFFNTLGNFLLESRAAILFIDPTTGDLLHVRGHAEIVWDGPDVAHLPSPQRLWRLRVTGGWWRHAA